MKLSPPPAPSATPRTIASVLESDFGFDAKEAARAGEVINEACGIALLLKYQEHHEFVASQLSKMLGVTLETSGDFKNLVDGLRADLTAAQSRAEQAEREAKRLTEQCRKRI